MKNAELLIKQALKTYDKITSRLESAINQQRKMPPRASRTTAYAAFQGRISRLRDLQVASYTRYLRRKEGIES